MGASIVCVDGSTWMTPPGFRHAIVDKGALLAEALDYRTVPSRPGQRRKRLGRDLRLIDAAILARLRLSALEVAAAKSPFLASARSSISFHEGMAIAIETSADDAIIAPSDMSGKR